MNCLRPKVYNEYLWALQYAIEGKEPKFNMKKYLDDKKADEFQVVIKNYDNPKGLSQKLTKADASIEYEIKGPLGKGLNPFSNGIHIAFTGGTGILPFIDLVAHLARKALKLMDEEDDAQLEPDLFKFVLFASFPDKYEAIGIELC